MAAMTHLRFRRGALWIASATGFSVAAAFCMTGAPASAESADCGAGAVIAVAGTNDPADGLIGVRQRYTGIGPDNTPGTADDDPRYTGDGKYRVLDAEYPATIWPMGAAGYDDSTGQGAAATARAISGYQAACQGKPVVVAGYSQGARVAGDVLAGIGTSAPVDENGDPREDGTYRLVDVENTPDDTSDDVLVNTEGLSGELYSDPRRTGDKTGRGIELSLIGIIPGLTMSGPRGETDADSGFGVLEGSVVSVCVDGDPICDLPDPVHDPIGAIDGLLGYFTKHNLYPYAMWRDPDQQWSTRPVACDVAGTGVCMVGADSAFAELVGGWARDVGYTGEIGDFLSGRPTLDLPFGIELANLQPVVALMQGFLPSLPQLGYGAYLPNVFVFEDILQGIVTLSPDRLLAGVTALADSVRSIVMLPVNFVRYWAGEIVGPVAVSGSNTAAVPAGVQVSRVGFAALVSNIGEDSAATTTEPADAGGSSGGGSSAGGSSAGHVAAGDSSAGESPSGETGVPAGPGSAGDSAGSAEDPDSGPDAGTGSGEEPADVPASDDELPAATDPSSDGADSPAGTDDSGSDGGAGDTSDNGNSDSDSDNNSDSGNSSSESDTAVD
ncbi:PE-PPE domain-containing protein [Gordonia jinghuaiqii]|uniref:PE-PPE domain-containing protein n=2 Tax=Gordonia jinghuaiqii TaxID=2758710 RepID=A0A7D7LTN9_9ACTN|nr:PE-PPE domain-containing protein [Gordonia jinghuaiqii]MCR5979924.1 PE-PPE domain-containing protein [Gordonia jinghuaiqii]QMT03125.1 PE-PPE domain-containing protein [Gordonia jinghuaiqii]